jgi:hypothetical protein
MKLVVGILSLMVAAALLARSIVDFVPDCETVAGIKKLVPPETTCKSLTGLAILLAMLGVTLAAAALRILSTDRDRPTTSP